MIVFGSNGLLGQSLVQTLHTEYNVIAVSRGVQNLSPVVDIEYHSVDMVNRSAMKDLLHTHKPDVIINAAAYTDVDGCEEHKEECWNTNVRAVENIVDFVTGFDPILVQVSTDYVFDGMRGQYDETDNVNPRGNYARSKMAAENIVISSNLEYIIARTQILYGYGNKSKLNFATWVLSRLSAKKPIKVVKDQHGNPTYVADLAFAIKRLLQEQEYGLFHVSGSETANRFEFAQKIADVFGLDSNLIEKITTEELNQASPRPQDSSFTIDKLVNRINWEPHDIKSGLKLLKQKLDEING